MPSFVNIGAYVDEGTMVDTWATVGSCAQIRQERPSLGRRRHRRRTRTAAGESDGHRDNCFIGARSEIVEGVIVEEGSVVSMGVFIGAEHQDLRRDTGEVLYGRVPAGPSCARLTARGGRPLQPLLRGDRESKSTRRRAPKRASTSFCAATEGANLCYLFLRSVPRKWAQFPASGTLAVRTPTRS
jgi:carbonic anhydrase/acetyltransferase-like protein (isoleucine patch superfamily)